ncbi:MAG TPA: ATP-binding protein [Pirellulales bacterium]|nr:ATP-binding protein [Pirellulales bacterium]
MSYRSFKRYLGETHLERKLLVLFGVCLFGLIAASFWVYSSQTDALVSKQNPSRGRLLVETIMLATHWEKIDLAQGGGLRDTRRSFDWEPYYAVLTSNLKNLDYQWKFIRPASTEEDKRPADEFEAKVVEEFLRAPPPSSEHEEQDNFRRRFTADGRRYEYFQPVYATHELCVQCHQLAVPGNKELAENDLIAVAKVSISNEATLADQSMNRAILIALGITTTFLAVIAAYLIIRYVIVKPLNHLREVSDAVSHGSLDQRAEIHTADEFEDLAVAFNRMLGNLVTAQDELRRLNSNLDLKVDELAQANMQLFELNRLKSDFLATMSHELRTPLNSIIGFSDVLSSIKSLDDKQRRYVQNIQKSGKMLLDMINDILDLAKIESGKMEVRPSDFRIEHVIGAQCDMARPLTERKNIDLDAEVQPGLPELYQDQGKVQQILNNLLSNAIKFTPEGGRIIVAARRSDSDRLELTVADTGVGIADEDQRWIFEKFRQGRTVMPGGDAMTREYSGTGLGLSIVKELCKLLGGDITLESELGKGSTFTVALPWTIADQTGVDSSLSALTMPRRDGFDSVSDGAPSAALPGGQA